MKYANKLRDVAISIVVLNSLFFGLVRMISYDPAVFESMDVKYHGPVTLLF